MPCYGRPRVPGPYVLVGHSNSGLFTQLYASTHPRQVAGLILIDAVHPAYHQRQLALLKPLLPPEVWEALRREAMTPPHRLVDPQGVDIWTEAAVTASQPTPPDPKVSPHRDPVESGSRQVLPSLADPVRQALDERSGGRLQLDPPTPRRSGQPI
jgi:pimeloyl-ACP methyl ester carboxylesterase